MTPPRTRRPKAPQKPAHGPAAADRVDAYLNGRPVNEAKRRLAIERHAAAGNPADLDWFTRQLIDPTRTVL